MPRGHLPFLTAFKVKETCLSVSDEKGGLQGSQFASFPL